MLSKHYLTVWLTIYKSTIAILDYFIIRLFTQLTTVLLPLLHFFSFSLSFRAFRGHIPFILKSTTIQNILAQDPQARDIGPFGNASLLGLIGHDVYFPDSITFLEESKWQMQHG